MRVEAGAEPKGILKCSRKKSRSVVETPSAAESDESASVSVVSDDSRSDRERRTARLSTSSIPTTGPGGRAGWVRHVVERQGNGLTKNGDWTTRNRTRAKPVTPHTARRCKRTVRLPGPQVITHQRPEQSTHATTPKLSVAGLADLPFVFLVTTGQLSRLS